jgi:hypothetical protein
MIDWLFICLFLFIFIYFIFIYFIFIYFILFIYFIFIFIASIRLLGDAEAYPVSVFIFSADVAWAFAMGMQARTTYWRKEPPPPPGSPRP